MTPMIDVVFLLLIFFMLASSFEREVAIQISAAGERGVLSSAPRIIDIAPSSLRLNGRVVLLGEMAAELDQIVAKRSDAIVLRPRNGADLQRLVDVMSKLGGLGFSALVLLE
ncbi:MAG: ExbD/TolR family protein [Boseongicola sp.]